MSRRLLPLALVAAALIAARPAHADPAPAAGEEEVQKLPLQWELQRRLPLGMLLDFAPGLVVARGGGKTGQLLGVTGYLKLEMYRRLVVFKSEVEAFEDGDLPGTRWSLGVHLGGELKPMQVVGQVLAPVKSVARRVF